VLRDIIGEEKLFKHASNSRKRKRDSEMLVDFGIAVAFQLVATESLPNA
jgi:hypothetical protein